MPRTPQIIPAYDVPHVMTVINDNSTVDPYVNVTVADPAVRFLCIFNSSKGPDGVTTLRNTRDYIQTYGRPDMRKYGQASYMPYLLLSTGNAAVHCMRVTADNASFANVVVTAKIENVPESTDETTGVVTPASTVVTFGTTTIPDIVILDNLENAVQSLTLDANTYPLMAFAVNGRGSYGNDISFRITSDLTSDVQTGFKNYIVEFLSRDSGLTRNEYHRCAMYVDAIEGTSSSFISDVINDPEGGSSMVTVYVNEDAIDTIYEAYVAATAETSRVTKNNFDIFFGNYAADGSKTSDVSAAVYKVDASGLNFNATTGTLFANGSDGDFAQSGYTLTAEQPADWDTAYASYFTKADDTYTAVTGVTGDDGSTTAPAWAADTYYTPITEATRNDAVTKAYLDAMSVTTTNPKYGRMAISKRRTPADVILDANFPVEVKKAMYALALQRGDAKVYLDCGTSNNNFSDLLTWDNVNFRDGNASYFASSDEDAMDYVVSREAQWYKTRDPFTGKIINVTYTWFLAQALPTHIITYGNQTPFIGERYSLLTGAIANSVRPNIDADDLETKQALWERRINTVDTLAENRYVRSTQVTVQTDISDLSEDNNVLVLLEMKRILEDMTLTKLYDFSEAEDRAAFTEDAERVFATYPNRKVRAFTVEFAMNEFEQARNILHCYLTVVFRQISTRGIVEIDINKRTDANTIVSE